MSSSFLRDHASWRDQQGDLHCVMKFRSIKIKAGVLFGEEKCSGKKELGKRIKLIKERMQRLSDLRFPSVAFYDINWILFNFPFGMVQIWNWKNEISAIFLCKPLQSCLVPYSNALNKKAQGLQQKCYLLDYTKKRTQSHSAFLPFSKSSLCDNFLSLLDGFTQSFGSPNKQEIFQTHISN